MKEIIIIALLSMCSNLLAGAVEVIKAKIDTYEYSTYIQRIERGEGFSGW